MIRLILTTVLALATGPLAAQETESLSFGDDAFIAGQDVVYDGDTVDDLFIAGQTVGIASGVGGTAHAAGRRVTVDAPVSGDLYAAAQSITINQAIAGDATLAGYEILISSAIGGDLRSGSSRLVLDAPVAGSAIIGAETVELNTVISGDLMLASENAEFGRDARIEGQLIIYEEDLGTLDIPARVAEDAQVERRELREWDGDVPSLAPRVSVRNVVGSFLAGVLVVTLAAALIAGLVPEHLAAMRKRIIASPFWILWIGFLSQSAVVGSAFILALTVVGLLAVPVSILLAILIGLLGYVIGAYAFGVGLMMAFGRPLPEDIGDRALAGAVGALAVGLIGLVPFLGWLFVLAVSLTGIGAIAMRLFRPAFFAEDPLAD